MSDKIHVDSNLGWTRQEKSFQPRFLCSCLLAWVLLFFNGLEWFFSSLTSDKILFLAVQVSFSSSIFKKAKEMNKNIASALFAINFIWNSDRKYRKQNKIRKKSIWIRLKVSRYQARAMERHLKYFYNKIVVFCSTNIFLLTSWFWLRKAT